MAYFIKSDDAVFIDRFLKNSKKEDYLQNFKKISQDYQEEKAETIHKTITDLYNQYYDVSFGVHCCSCIEGTKDYTQKYIRLCYYLNTANYFDVYHFAIIQLEKINSVLISNDYKKISIDKIRYLYNDVIGVYIILFPVFCCLSEIIRINYEMQAIKNRDYFLSELEYDLQKKDKKGKVHNETVISTFEYYCSFYNNGFLNHNNPKEKYSYAYCADSIFADIIPGRLNNFFNPFNYKKYGDNNNCFKIVLICKNDNLPDGTKAYYFNTINDKLFKIEEYLWCGEFGDKINSETAKEILKLNNIKFSEKKTEIKYDINYDSDFDKYPCCKVKLKY